MKNLIHISSKNQEMINREEQLSREGACYWIRIPTLNHNGHSRLARSQLRCSFNHCPQSVRLQAHWVQCLSTRRGQAVVFRRTDLQQPGKEMRRYPCLYPSLRAICLSTTFWFFFKTATGGVGITVEREYLTKVNHLRLYK